MIPLPDAPALRQISLILTNIIEYFVFMKIQNMHVGIPRHSLHGYKSIHRVEVLCPPFSAVARSSEAVYNDTDLGAANMESYDPKGVTLGKLRDQAKCGFYVYKLGLMLLSAMEGY